MKYFNTIKLDYENLIFNIKYIKSKNLNSLICGVVKANAYGCGVKLICENICDYVDYFAVACVMESREIRKFNKKTPILILGKVDVKDVEWCSKNNIEITVISLDHLFEIVNVLKGKRLNCKIKIHIKINTGLNRFGLKNIIEIKNALKLAEINDKNITIAGVYTHFATKQENEKFLNLQYEKFLVLTTSFKNVIMHCSNTNASIHQNMGMNMVRVGFGLYVGMEPLKCIVKITAKIINVLEVEKGESVGYSRNFIANKKTKIAIVSLGYADGFNRSLSNNFKLYCNGYFCNVVGNICMDVCVIDITNTNIKVDDVVEILGDNIKLSDYAHCLKTSEYAVLLGFSSMRANKILVNKYK